MSARLDLMDIDGGGETGPSKGEGEAADPASEKIQASLTNVVELLDLFAELTEELSRGKHCRERVVQEASWSSVEKIKALRSRLRSVIPSHMGAGAAGPNAGSVAHSFTHPIAPSLAPISLTPSIANASKRLMRCVSVFFLLCHDRRTMWPAFDDGLQRGLKLALSRAGLAAWASTGTWTRAWTVTSNKRRPRSP